MNKRGFTLLELVVVMVLIAILAATALVKFGELGRKARDGMIDAGYGTVRVALFQSVAHAAKFPRPVEFKDIVKNEIKLEKGISFGTDNEPTPTSWTFDIRVGEAGGGRKATCTYSYTSDTQADLSLSEKVDY